MFFHRRTIPGLAIHSYLIGNESSGECAVIDPVRDVEEYLQLTKENGLEICYILETHVHADFVSGSKELKKASKGKAQIYCSGLGGEAWTPSYADCVVKDGDEIAMGNLVLKAIHTPGHTPEHISWLLSEDGEEIKLFTGDLLFVGAVGRPDLLGKEEVDRLSHQLYDSVFKKLSQFSDFVEVRPAHGAGSLCGKALGSAPYSSMGIERSHNLYLKEKPENEWINALLDEMPLAPHYFTRMKKVNIKGAEFVEKVTKDLKPLTVKEVKEKSAEGAMFLDLRSKEAFSSAHIPGSINIPISPQVSTWAGWVLPYPTPVVLILEEDEHLEPAVTQLLRIGYDCILGFLKGGIREWETSGSKLSELNILSVQDLIKNLGDTFVVDIRTKSEWDRGHIQSAHFIEGGQIAERMNEIPKDQQVAVICGSGFRASIIVSLLKRSGYDKISNVFGGMQAWIQEGYPVSGQ
ncbi:uncharacterized protein ycbL [Waddlia chondrophila 2032/99]|uniref:Uncharacterized protein ycbL n=1 Tax=Waddlia chondrophila 2032/99 TaxID=765953 RepID=F8LFE9_9BACT|nr:uncharacterized protein ycbL [Waddlia chondrophila 2032/99]